MSRTWDLQLNGHDDAQIHLSENKLDLDLSIEYPIGSLSCRLDDDEAREIRDWLSWYLHEGPEPGRAR